MPKQGPQASTYLIRGHRQGFGQLGLHPHGHALKPSCPSPCLGGRSRFAYNPPALSRVSPVQMSGTIPLLTIPPFPSSFYLPVKLLTRPSWRPFQKWRERDQKINRGFQKQKSSGKIRRKKKKIGGRRSLQHCYRAQSREQETGFGSAFNSLLVGKGMGMVLAFTELPAGASLVPPALPLESAQRCRTELEMPIWWQPHQKPSVASSP